MADVFAQRRRVWRAGISRAFLTQEWLRWILTNRFIVFTGTISYGLYLLHKIPFNAAKAFHLDGNPGLMMSALLLAGYAVAAVSWFMLEKPFLRLKRLFEPPSARTSPDPQEAALAQ